MTGPTIAAGNVRQCYEGLIALAEHRAEVDPHPERRRRWRRLGRYITQRLARAIIRDAGR